MKKSVEKTGKNAQEALNNALNELGLERDEVEVKVVDEGKRGLFGFIGSKLSKVIVTPKDIVFEKVKDFLSNIIKKMDLNVTINIKRENNCININLVGKDVGILIGKRGETLNSLQYLTSLVANKHSKEYVKVCIDSQNYRKRREESLSRLARKLADRVITYRRNITLEPMNPYERRIIHSTLQNNKMVTTYSIGEEPNRKVVIAVNNRKKTIW